MVCYQRGDNMTFCDRIRALREDNDLTQEAIAKIFNTTQRRISYLENGITHPTLKDIEQYCYFFNISADYILGFTNTPKDIR